MSSHHHPPGTIILEPQVLLHPGGGVVRRAPQHLPPQYNAIAYPGMCPPNLNAQANAVQHTVTLPVSASYSSVSANVDPLKYAFQNWLPNAPVALNTVQAHDLPGNAYYQQGQQAAAAAAAAAGSGSGQQRRSAGGETKRLGRERAKRKRDNEDDATRESRLKKNRDAARNRRAGEPIDQRGDRLQRNREQARYRRATEDQDSKKTRQARERERVRIKRMNETPEVKAERRRREMEKKRLMRGITQTTSNPATPSMSAPTSSVAAAAAAAAAAVLGDRKFLIPSHGVHPGASAGVRFINGHHPGQPPMNLIGHFEAFVNGQQQQQWALTGDSKPPPPSGEDMVQTAREVILGMTNQYVPQFVAKEEVVDAEEEEEQQ